MAIDLRQQVQTKQVQSMAMTQELRQAIGLLQLNQLELLSAIQEELQENPALEENHQSESDFLENTPDNSATDLPNDSQQAMAETDWSQHEDTFDADASFTREKPADDLPSQFEFISEQPTLTAYLQWQLAHEELDSKEMEIALFIIGNLNRHGFLEVTIKEIIEQAQCNEEDAEYILYDVVQMLDPSGIAAHNVGESLFIQLQRMGKEKSLAAQIVKDYMDLLKIKDYRTISKKLGRKKPEIERAVHFIVENLTPYPGLLYNSDDTNYIVPDVYVRKIEGEYVVQIESASLPQLQLSSNIQELLKNGKKLDKGERNYMQEKLKGAVWFMKSLQQREQTIYKVMSAILEFQGDFFEKGAEYLKPLILKDVAQAIDMHESTVSRITSNKYVHTPQGIFELKYFFSTAIPKNDGSALASESIKTILRKIVNGEDKTKPLSDSAIEKELKKQNIKIARRTIAKYREQLNIPPVQIRRQR